MTRLFSKFFRGACALSLAAGIAAAPAIAADREDRDRREINIDIGDEEDFLEDLIAMDAEDIAELRTEFAEARAEIAEAAGEIEEARREARSAPGGEMILKIAFAAASAATKSSVDGALAKVERAIDRAEKDLKTADVSDEERVETQLAIDTLRSEMAGLREALADLVAAMEA